MEGLTLLTTMLVFSSEGRGGRGTNEPSTEKFGFTLISPEEQRKQKRAFCV